MIHYKVQFLEFRKDCLYPDYTFSVLLQGHIYCLANADGGHFRLDLPIALSKDLSKDLSTIPLKVLTKIAPKNLSKKPSLSTQAASVKGT